MQEISKGWEEKSTRRNAAREPRLVEWGAREVGEHGLGAGASIGRCPRVRPLKRFEARAACESGWYHGIFIVLGVFQGRFLTQNYPPRPKGIIEIWRNLL